MAEKRFVNPPGLKPLGMYSNTACGRGTMVFIAGQVAVDAEGRIVGKGDIEAQAVQVFENLKAVCEAAGGSLADIAKLNIFLTDLANFATVNEVMGRYFQQPYPARAAIGVASLPRGAQVEMDGILVLE